MESEGVTWVTVLGAPVQKVSEIDLGVCVVVSIYLKNFIVVHCKEQRLRTLVEHHLNYGVTEAN